MVGELLGRLGQNLAEALVVFGILLLATVVVFARDRAPDFFIAFVRVGVSLFTAPVAYLGAAVRGLAEDTSGAEGPHGNRQYLLQRLLLLLRAGVVFVALATLASWLAAGWASMVPSRSLRELNTELQGQLRTTRGQLATARGALGDLDDEWLGSETREELLAPVMTPLRTELENRARIVSERAGVPAQTILGNIGVARTPAQVRHYVDRLVDDVGWATTNSTTTIEPQVLGALVSWGRAWFAFNQASLDEDGLRSTAQPEYARTRRDLDTLTATRDRLESSLNELAPRLEWMQGRFLGAAAIGLLQTLLLVWVLGVVLEGLWLGVDIAANVRGLRAAQNPSPGLGEER